MRIKGQSKANKSIFSENNFCRFKLVKKNFFINIQSQINLNYSSNCLIDFLIESFKNKEILELIDSYVSYFEKINFSMHILSINF